MKYALWICIIMLSGGGVTAAQEFCTGIERAAMASLAEACAGTPADSVCYGFRTLYAAGQDAETPAAAFTTPGHLLPTGDVGLLLSSSEDDTWGVALVHTRAYPPGDWAAQEVVLVLMGNVLLQNGGQEGVEVLTQDVQVAAAAGANVRSGPSLEFRVLTPVFDGEMLKATGRLEDGSWLRVQLRDGRPGWLAADVIADDAAGLPVVTYEDTPPELLYLPMQDFALQSGLQDARCPEVPDSGLLLQTPDTQTMLTFRVNGLELLLAGTAFLQARPLDYLALSVLEGQAELRAPDVVRTVAAGQFIHVPLDETGQALPGVTSPMPYNYTRMLTLPVTLLPRPDVVIGLDLSTIIMPRPGHGGSPLAGLPADGPCVITVGEGGANLRTGPGMEFPVRGVIGFRESAEPLARAFGRDNSIWWKLAEFVWLRQDTTVTAGNCAALPVEESP